MRRTLLIAVFICVILPFTLLLKAEVCMWEVENGKNKLFLLGSIHLMPEDTYPLDEQIESAYAESDILVVELDPTNLDQEKVNNVIIQTAFYPEGTTLQSEIPVELYTEVAAKFTELGISADQLNSFKPWFVGLNLNLGALQKLDVKTGMGIDLHFINKTHEKQMTLLELETATSQLEALSSMPDSVQVDFLQYTLDDFNMIEEVFMEILAAWKIGDAEKLNQLTKVKMLEAADEIPGVTDYYNKLFTERDGKILEKLVGFLENEEEHTYFVIVGAFHLIGDDGLIQMLDDKEYKTKQY